MLLREIEEALGGSAGGTCKMGGKSQVKKAGCWREGMRSSRGNGWCCAMEEWRTGRLTRTRSKAEREEEAPPRLVIEPSEWREVSLVQVDEANGGLLTMKLLRPLSWLDSEAVAVGAWVSLDLRELGVQGEALVTAVAPCPEIEQGEGRLVTGTFRRSQALVCELKVSGASEVLGVTPNHLVWSEDRCDWVAVADLRLGERLRAWDGSTPVVESLTACEEPEPVYNIEVEGDHCYRVGEQGLLVHNASVPRWCAGMSVTPGGGSARDVMRLTTLYFRSQLTQGQITNNPASLTATEVPIIKRVRAKLATGGGSGSSTAVRNLFVQMQYWINGGDYQAALNAGIRDPIGLSTDTDGHIIGRQFGGQGSFPAGSTAVAPDNVFPQSRANQDWYEQIETMWATSVAAGNTVCVEITLVYRGGTDPARYRPREVRVEWWEDCGGTVTNHSLASQAN